MILPWKNNSTRLQQMRCDFFIRSRPRLRAYRIIKEETRVIYELIDHDPENIKARKKQDDLGDEEFVFDNWDPDY